MISLPSRPQLGDNTFRQVTGYAFDRNIASPLLLSQFSGKKIKGVCAFENTSVNF